MKTSFLFAGIAGCALLVPRANAATALDAAKLIPDVDRANLAIIDGHDGNPTPDRWHFVFYDRAAENGVREYVVEDGQVVARREVSQFASELKPSDVVGLAALNVDSDTVTRMAGRFAAANGREIASMNLALRRDPVDGEALWSVVCCDTQGEAFASLIVTANEGRIVSHEGFFIDPNAPKKAVAQNRPVRSGTMRRSPDRPPPIYQGPSDEDDRVPVRRAEPVRRERPPRLPNPIDDVIKPIHRIVRSLLPF